MAWVFEKLSRPMALMPRVVVDFFSQFPLHLALALVIGLDSIGFAIALASLMFAGGMTSGIGMAVTAVLSCSILMSVFVGLRSQLKINIAGAQDIGVAVLAVSLATAVSNVTPEAKVATAFAIIAAATLTTGIVLFATGYFKAGRLVRFFPLEVLAGFMAATGCLLLIGGIAMVAHVESSLNGLLSIGSAGQFMQLLPAVLLAIIIGLAMTYISKPFVLLAILVGAALLFHGWLKMFGITPSEAVVFGFLPDVPATRGVEFPFPALLPLVDWRAVMAAAPLFGTVALLSLFAAMMNISALELATGKELDVDREIKIVGGTNLLVTGFAGPPGYSDLASTQLLNKSGVASRGVGLLVTAVELFGLFYAAYVASLVPVMVSAGLVMYYGYDLVSDWLLKTRKSYSAQEWGVVLLIVVISVGYSILLAILAGFLIATILFAYSYSNAPVIRNVTSLARLPSTTDRAPDETIMLSERGRAVQVIQLQGFLFFGTSEQVVARVRTAAENSGVELRCVIIDFSRVTNLDSASANALKRIENLATAKNFSVMFCGLNAKVEESLRRSDLTIASGDRISVYDSLDLALEVAETEILKNKVAASKEKSLAEQFANASASAQDLEKLFAAMSRKTFVAGDVIIKSGTEAKDIYFVESGRAVVFRPGAGSSPKRMRTMTAGAILGEVAYSLGTTRTADVIAEADTVLLCMSLAGAKKLAKNKPALAILFNQLVGRALAEKVLAANRMTEHVS